MSLNKETEDDTRSDTTTLKEALSQHILLRDETGYIASATKIIAGSAEKAKVKVGFVEEMGISKIPSFGDGPKRTFEEYAVRISWVGKYDDSVRFLQALERTNPYLTVTGFQAVKKDASHEPAISIITRWPVRAAPERPAYRRLPYSMF